MKRYNIESNKVEHSYLGEMARDVYYAFKRAVSGEKDKDINPHQVDTILGARIADDSDFVEQQTYARRNLDGSWNVYQLTMNKISDYRVQSPRGLFTNIARMLPYNKGGRSPRLTVLEKDVTVRDAFNRVKEESLFHASPARNRDPQSSPFYVDNIKSALRL